MTKHGRPYNIVQLYMWRAQAKNLYDHFVDQGRDPLSLDVKWALDDYHRYNREIFDFVKLYDHGGDCLSYIEKEASKLQLQVDCLNRLFENTSPDGSALHGVASAMKYGLAIPK